MAHHLLNPTAIPSADAARDVTGETLRKGEGHGTGAAPNHGAYVKEDRPMLVLSRKIGEKLVIGDGIVVTVNRIVGHRVSLGVEAPPDVRIVRSELQARDEAAAEKSPSLAHA